MGVPILRPEPAQASTNSLAEASAARAALNEASLAADSSLRSLSSLLLAARAATAPLAYAAAPPSLDLPMPSLAAMPRLPAPRPHAPPPPPVSAFRQLVAAQPPSSPPPLAPASDTESEPEWDDLPSLLSDSPHSQHGLDELFCPWAPRAGGDQPMRDAPPLPLPSRTTVLRPAAFRTSFFGSPHARAESVWTGAAGRAPRHRSLLPASGSPPPQAPLEAELASLACKAAQLVQAHREQLRGADLHIRNGLQDVANQLAALAGMVRAGPPPPA
ncbi:expressed protein [Chlorella variabilis]|uniref:Expressed protein n=1 Tax=Chlorella variabilis TaxID=554065 RepID=E1Z319_CHLVA|nr:expressed protein [Chlorella variabilis]EFN59761.1 expressed protein [Chlorella variabilis]|eukprot:XP_005851863.1 expressed protein [Chlorella variabilis]